MAHLRVFLSRCRGLWFGNLNNGAIGGLRCVNANNGLTNARWNILRRLCDQNSFIASCSAGNGPENRPWRMPKIGRDGTDMRRSHGGRTAKGTCVGVSSKPESP